jgi:hypothetical protein
LPNSTSNPSHERLQWPPHPQSPHWAFVVQLRQGTALIPQALHGRVEHIVSGQAAFFTGLEQLGSFMAQI